MGSIAESARAPAVIVGVDTHKHMHVAAVLDELGTKLGDQCFPADPDGYVALLAWARGFGHVTSFGIEGTGSYGVGLASHLRRAGHKIIEVNRGNRQLRRANGKSDPVDAEIAARSVLAGTANSIPKSADGAVEMIRQIKVARDTAVKGRTSAIITLKQLVVNAPDELRETLRTLKDKALIDRCSRFRIPPPTDPTGSARHSLRALARRWRMLDEEIREHDRLLANLTKQTSPTLCDAFGIGADTAAEMLIIFGDNPDRIRSEAALAKLCGACPVPASSGQITRHRLYRGGHRQANAALYRTAIVRLQHHQPTIDYAIRRTAEGRSKRDIIRCVKRFLAREIYQAVMADHRARTPADASS